MDIALDVETTGLDPGEDLTVQIAVAVSPADIFVSDVGYRRFGRVRQRRAEPAFKITGWTAARIRTAWDQGLTPGAVDRMLVHWLALRGITPTCRPTAIVGLNIARFDQAFVARQFPLTSDVLGGRNWADLNAVFAATDRRHLRPSPSARTEAEAWAKAHNSAIGHPHDAGWDAVQALLMWQYVTAPPPTHQEEPSP